MMAVERLTLSPVPVPVVVGEEEVNKAPRLPRWTRQELLVLIQGKRVAESRVRRGSRSAVMSEQQVEPKWSSVSSYCKRHGVNRGPVQCRKRWSNLAGDFRKIKEWESQINKEEDASDSFWVMRNDLRRERKLPGFFDREVYDILDDAPPAPAPPLTLSLAPSNDDNEVFFDSGRTPADDGLFSDDAAPLSATQSEPLEDPPAAAADKESSPSPEATYQGRKRKRPGPDAEQQQQQQEMSLQKQLIEAMERNGRLLSSQLEIQNANSQLDREQRKDYANSLFAVLNKLADAMVRIADKL